MTHPNFENERRTLMTTTNPNQKAALMRKVTTLATAIALLVAVACSSGETTAPVVITPEATPDISATVRAQVQGTVRALGATVIEPTAAPTLDAAELMTFAALHGDIETRWESFHGDVDAWRQGLVACDVTTRSQARSGFAVRFASVTEGARSLPRIELVRGISDQIIAAADREAAALRGLNELTVFDPTVTPSVSAAEFVEIERAAAANIRLAAESTLSDLTVGSSDDSRAVLGRFVSGVQDIDSEWDKFITDYESFRASQPGLDPADVTDALSALVSQFLSVSSDIQELSLGTNTIPIAAQLSLAARNTELALRTLRDAAVDVARAAALAAADSESEGASSATVPETLDFVAFETILVGGNGDRSAAGALLSPIVASASVDTAAIAAAFSTAYGPVAATWDKFHQDYDSWRASNGGCNVTSALEQLGDFVVDFGSIASDVRAVPRTIALRTLGELLIEAAEREALAIASLRAGWQPFDSTVYDQFDLSRTAANKLRRQVSSGLAELLAQSETQ